MRTACFTHIVVLCVKRVDILHLRTCCIILPSTVLWCRDGAANTVEENSSVFSLIQMC